MSTETKEFGLETLHHSGELATTGAAAEKQHEIQSAIIVARRFPRNEDECFQKLMKAAMRPSFAEDATYNFPRGGSEVSGPSVNLAREAGRVWGNVRYGVDIIRDDDTSRLIRGWAWDLETNTKVTAEDDFKKLIQRKQKNGSTAWVIPDERDLRELTNRRAAILVRNCILQILPKDMIEDALSMCAQTLESNAKDDPDKARKRLIVDFAKVNVSMPMIEAKLGTALAQASPKELAELRGVYKSIIDGNSTWAEYAAQDAPEDPNAVKLAAAQAEHAAKNGQSVTPPATPAPVQASEPSEPAEDAAAEPEWFEDVQAWKEWCHAMDAKHKAQFVAAKKQAGLQPRTPASSLPVEKRASFVAVFRRIQSGQAA